VASLRCHSTARNPQIEIHKFLSRPNCLHDNDSCRISIPRRTDLRSVARRPLDAQRIDLIDDHGHVKPLRPLQTMDVNAVPCLVTSQWTSLAQLLLSRINAPKHRNVLELLSFGTQLRAVPNGNSSSVRLLYHEYQVIGALLKKNRAQHRCGRWWQRLEGVRRSLKATFCGEARNGGASGTLMVPGMFLCNMHPIGCFAPAARMGNVMQRGKLCCAR
jgi:hypothetical protein